MSSEIVMYAKKFYEMKYIESGYIAVRKDDGILINATGTNLAELSEDNLVFVNDKNIETFEGNFRAAAVILYCAIRQSKVIEAAAIVDSDSILKLSSKRRALKPILDDLVKLCGISVKCATKNVAAEVVTALAGQRNACFMPDAGALVRGRSLEELFAAVAVLDKAAYAELIAEDKGGTQSMNPVEAFLECMLYKLKSSKNAGKQNGADGVQTNVEEKIEQKDEQQSEQSEEHIGENCEQECPQSAECNCENAEQNAQSTSEQQKASNNENACAKCNACDNLTTLNLFEGKLAVLMHSYYASAASAMGKPFEVQEKYADVLGQQIPCAPSTLVCIKNSLGKVKDVIGDAPACIVAQHGVVVCGKDMDEIKKICATLEKACEEYLA
ncbi:MAG: class II aldolase/adducin family protein [Clostridia bacterium]|nr:class II aldolase/adducin family protein [Clostridia bacterium]